MAEEVTRGLTPQQLEALNEVQMVTQAVNPQREVEELRRANWNVQTALQAIFDDAPAAAASGSTTATAPPANIEQMELDDTLQGSSGSRRAPASAYPTTPLGLNLPRLFTYPLHVTISLFSFVLRIIGFPLRLLGIPLPRLPPISRAGSLTFFSRGNGSGTDDPRTACMRWVRQLEEDTGAVSPGTATGTVEKGKEAAEAGAVLPNFFLGSYEEALRFAQRELRVLCVVLVSEEHDDVPGFKRNVLANQDVVRTLTEHNFVVWGGDVLERDAYQASLKLSTTSYPFVAFISLQPPPSSRSSSSSTASQLSVVSRITPLSPTALTTHITSVVLPRTTSFLQRLKTAEQMRIRERQLREEQDRALEEAMKRDGERIRAIREKEREEKEREKEEEERKRAKAEEGERRERKKAERETWRRYARRALVPAEPAQGVRVTVRISSGQRRTRTFASSDSVEAIYIWTETLSIPSDQSAAEDPNEGPARYEHEWDFVLATTFPRVVVPCDAEQRVGDVDVLRGGVVLVVEGTALAEEEDESEEESEEEDEE